MAAPTTIADGMNFNEARRILRDLGYSIRIAVDRLPGVTEYNVHRIWQDPDTQQMQIKRWLLTADSIKDGIYRAKHLATNQEQGLS